MLKRRTLLLALALAVPACLGSECSGGASGAGTGGSGPAQAISVRPADLAAPIPEPGSALIFGLGLLVARTAARSRSART